MSENQTILEFDVDVSTVEEPVPLPVGEYIGVVTSARVRMSNAGTQYVETAFRIDPEQYPADYDVDEEPDGVILYWRRAPYSSTRKDISKLRKFAKSLGVTMVGSRFDVEEWVGREAKLTIAHEEYEGEERAQIQRVSSVD